MLEIALLEGNYSVTCRVDCVVAAHECAIASSLGGASLTNNYLAGFDNLTAVEFDAKTFTSAVSVIFGSTACFDM